MWDLYGEVVTSMWNKYDRLNRYELSGLLYHPTEAERFVRVAHLLEDIEYFLAIIRVSAHVDVIGEYSQVLEARSCSQSTKRKEVEKPSRLNFRSR